MIVGINLWWEEPFPADIRADDIVHWQTTLTIRNAESAAQQLRDAKVSFVSTGVAEFAKEQLNFKKGFLIRDPDGHALRVTEK